MSKPAGRRGLSTKQLWLGVLALIVVWVVVAIAKHHDPTLTRSEVYELRTSYHVHFSKVVTSDTLMNTNTGKTVPNERSFTVQDFAGNFYEVDVDTVINQINDVWRLHGFLAQDRGEPIYPTG